MEQVEVLCLTLGKAQHAKQFEGPVLSILQLCCWLWKFGRQQLKLSKSRLQDWIELHRMAECMLKNGLNNLNILLHDTYGVAIDQEKQQASGHEHSSVSWVDE